MKIAREFIKKIKFVAETYELVAKNQFIQRVSSGAEVKSKRDECYRILEDGFKEAFRVASTWDLTPIKTDTAVANLITMVYGAMIELDVVIKLRKIMLNPNIEIKLPECTEFMLHKPTPDRSRFLPLETDSDLVALMYRQMFQITEMSYMEQMQLEEAWRQFNEFTARPDRFRAFWHEMFMVLKSIIDRADFRYQPILEDEFMHMLREATVAWRSEVYAAGGGFDGKLLRLASPIDTICQFVNEIQTALYDRKPMTGSNNQP